MAYESKTWECGEVVTADALNHMEQGIADAGDVEVSKTLLMNASGSLVQIGSSTVYVSAGGGSVVGGKTLGDLIGDKKLIGIEVVAVTANGESKFPTFGRVNMNGGSVTSLTNPVLLNDDIEARNGLQGGTYTAVTNESNATSFNIYAICI